MNYVKEKDPEAAWLVQLVECVTLDLGIVSLSPMLGGEMTSSVPLTAIC